MGTGGLWIYDCRLAIADLGLGAGLTAKYTKYTKGGMKMKLCIMRGNSIPWRHVSLPESGVVATHSKTNISYQRRSVVLQPQT